MQLIFCGSGWLPVVDCIRVRLPAGFTIDVWDRSAPLADAVRGTQVILPSNARITAEVIAAASELRLIQQPAAGVDGIDLAAAAERNVPVCNAPGGNQAAVAQAALFLMLALARRYPRARETFARGGLGVPLGVELGGRQLGIVGLGRTGRALADCAAGLGMVIRSVGSTSRRADLLALLEASDVISIHCPLTADTRGMFDAEAFAAMKPGAILVNCARGPIVERAALEAALKAGHLGGVGLDTYWEEPWDPDDPLYARDDVVTLPHIAGSTEESFARIADMVVGNVERVMRGEEPEFRVA